VGVGVCERVDGTVGVCVEVAVDSAAVLDVVAVALHVRVGLRVLV
jgi:hypothetical protein